MTAKEGRRSNRVIKRCSEGEEKINVEGKDGKLCSRSWTAGAGQFPLDLFTRSFQQADLAVSWGFMELCADSPGLGSPCKHLCLASKREEGRNISQTPNNVSCG